jgi:hypothetical protein
MNTKKLIFGLLAVVTLVASSVSTTLITDQQTTSIQKKKLTLKK